MVLDARQVEDMETPQTDSQRESQENDDTVTSPAPDPPLLLRQVASKNSPYDIEHLNRRVAGMTDTERNLFLCRVRDMGHPDLVAWTAQLGLFSFHHVN